MASPEAPSAILPFKQHKFNGLENKLAQWKPPKKREPDCELAIHSFFTGAGFLDLGFENSGFSVKSINESHRPFIDGYLHGTSKLRKKAEPIVFEHSIAEFVNNKKHLQIPSLKDTPVGFVGGPPCPDFSTAGKQRGKLGSNGRLTGIYMRLICEKKPDWFLFENVKGLWSTKKHKLFYDEICKEFINNGYVLTHRMVNSLEYGAPQDRDRIILIGFKAKNISQKPGWLMSGVFPWDSHIKYSKEDVIKRPWPNTCQFGSSPDFRKGSLKTLTVEHWFKKNQVDTHANSNDFFTPRAALHKFQTIMEGDVSGKSFKRLHRWRYSPTAAYGNNEVHLHPYEERRISVAEALAIQTTPKGFELPPTMTLSNKFKTVGNGVPFLLASGIAGSIHEFLKRNN